MNFAEKIILPSFEDTNLFKAGDRVTLSEEGKKTFFQKRQREYLPIEGTVLSMSHISPIVTVKMDWRKSNERMHEDFWVKIPNESEK